MLNSPTFKIRDHCECILKSLSAPTSLVPLALAALISSIPTSSISASPAKVPPAPQEKEESPAKVLLASVHWVQELSATALLTPNKPGYSY